MKKVTCILALLLLGTVAPITQTSAQTMPPEIAFDSTNFAQLPANMYLGEAAGVAVNSKGHVFVFHRGNSSGPAYGAAAAQLLEFDANGKYLREIGRNLYAWSFAHSVRVDRDDNIWVADKGSDMVVKFSPAGKVLMTFGRKLEASDEEAHPLEQPRPPLPPVNGLFRQVTDMAWDSKGNTFVSDGYINARVAKYDHDGNFLFSFGEPGAEPGQLNTPHSIAIDASDNVYVADRGNGRVQVFDTDGKFKRLFKIDLPVPPDARPVVGNPANPNGAKTQLPGSPWTLCITPGPTQYLYVSDSFPGRIYKLSLDGKVLGLLGGGGRVLKKFGWIHELACPSENTIYAAELLNWRVQKLTLHPK